MMTNGPNDGMTEHYTISLYASPSLQERGIKTPVPHFKKQAYGSQIEIGISLNLQKYPDHLQIR